MYVCNEIRCVTEESLSRRVYALLHLCAGLTDGTLFRSNNLSFINSARSCMYNMGIKKFDLCSAMKNEGISYG